MWKRIFKQKVNSIAVAAVLVAASSLISRLLGVFRDRILASQFGAGPQLDIYYAAFRVPDLLFNLIVLGALSAGFIPIFSGLVKNFSNPKKTEDNAAAWSLAANVINLLSVFLVFFSFVGILFAPLLVKLITPGFSADSQAATASLTRIMFLSPLFLGISGVLGGMLQSFRRFFIYSLAPIFYNLGIIAGTIWFSSWWGLPGLAWGVVLGALLHMLIQIPAVYALGFRYSFKINFKDQAARRIGRLMIPRTLSLAITQIDLLVTTIIASGLTAGSLTVFNLANNLQSFPVGIFGVSFAIAAFPTLSQVAFNKEQLEASFSSTLRQILFFVIPATVFLITLRAQIIRVVLGAGVFGWQDTILTMNTLALFSISLFAQASIPLIVRVFYARHDSKTPFYLGMFTVAADIILCLILSRKMGVTGLALAYSISNILNFLLLWTWLHFTIGGLGISKIVRSAIKLSLATIGAGLSIQLMKIAVLPFIDMTKFSGVFIQLIVAATAGGLAYLLLCYLLGSEELITFINSIRRHRPVKTTELEDSDEARGL
ncbi:MAG: murein biosynthesis integral membrane protein MurJ [Candidatus Falkowbacteria bacterium]